MKTVREQGDLPQPLPREWDCFIQAADACAFPACARVLHQGQQPTAVFLITAGATKLIRSAASGKDAIVGWRFRGGILGAAPVLAGRTCPVSTETLTATEFLRVSKARFRELLTENVDLSREVHRLQGLEACEQFIQAGRFACMPAYERLEAVLADLVRVQGAATGSDLSVRIGWPVKHGELAQAIAVTPESLSRLLGVLETDGVVKRENGWLVVPNPDRLLEHGSLT